MYLLVRLSADRRGNHIKVLFDMLINVLLAERAGVIFLFLGKPCEPFGSGKQRIGTDRPKDSLVDRACLRYRRLIFFTFF